MKICKIKNCNNSIHYKDGGAKGYCRKHYLQICRYGRILKRTRFDPNKIINHKNYYEICLYGKETIGKGQTEIAKTKIDKEDLKKIKQYKWGLTEQGYAQNVKNRLFLHHLIIGKTKKYIVDHINHDKLDNRKQNLRIATYSQNQMNRKNVKGYYWLKKSKKWEVKICINYNKIYLGCFASKQDAMNIRHQAEKKYFGEYTCH